MASIQDQYDTALLGILQNEGNIVQFLDVCFSFLARRTDFYVRMTSQQDKMGFPEGVAEKLVLKSFKKFERLASAASKRTETKGQKQNKDTCSAQAPKAKPTDSDVITAHVVPEAELAEERNHNVTDADSPMSKDGTSTVSTPCTDENSTATLKTANTVESKLGCVDQPQLESTQSEETKQPIYQANPDSYNGAIRDGYSWSQSITDVDLKVWVPSCILKGKDVFVDVKKKHLALGYRQSGGEKQMLMDAGLTWEVHKEDCIWSLDPGKCVTISLEKVQERWWEAVFVDEPKINVQKIDPSRPMTDLDDEAQAKIEEMMYNDRQKKLGLPQSHEQKVQDMLRKGWDVEGSPFKGQPFDPSKLNISSG